MTISGRTISYIIYLLRSELPEVYKDLPKWDKTHTDKRVDYSNLILEKHLAILTPQYKDTLISLIQDHKAEEVKQFIYGLDIWTDLQ